MANYNSLKAAINAYIKRNGQRKITGDILNAVLNAAVDALGAGYQFMGVAGAATDPGTPDVRVFYIAPAGTYPSFGGTVVPEGSIGIFTYGDAWSYEVMEIGGGGSADAVLYVEQTLTAEQKAQARSNIGAGTGNGTYSKPSDGIPETDFAQSVRNDLGMARTAVQPAALKEVTDLIPAQATPQNQLADKLFVNSSVATNTANYISDDGVPFSSLEDLEAYGGTLTNNDYAFVVGTDAAGNTTYTRYKYNASTGEWAEEYVLNNSSFTAAQWEAISSGITTLLVSKLENIPGELLLYSAQTLTAAQQLQARTNIGAYAKPSEGIPATDIAPGVIPVVEALTTAEIDTIWNAAMA